MQKVMVGRKSSILSVALVLAAVGVPSAANATDMPWVGIWAADASWCKFKDKIGVHTPAPIRITAKEIQGMENTCTIETVKPGGIRQAWTINATCSGEGEQYKRQSLFIVSKDEKELHIAEDDGSVTAFKRCR